MLPDKINPATGQAPSLLVVSVAASSAVKPCRIVKSVPLVLSANTVPLSELPPKNAVPYRVLPDKTNPALGMLPSLPFVKLYRFVKPVPLVLTANTVPKPLVPPSLAVPYRVLPDNTNPAYGTDPSLPSVKLYTVVKPVPLVLMANTVP